MLLPKSLGKDPALTPLASGGHSLSLTSVLQFLSLLPRGALSMCLGQNPLLIWTTILLN